MWSAGVSEIMECFVLCFFALERLTDLQQQQQHLKISAASHGCRLLKQPDKYLTDIKGEPE
jgi:hypothetical protein